METNKADDRFWNIPKSLRIEILYEDADIVVIHKPPNLRSVPGHASSSSSTSSEKHLHGAKRKASSHPQKDVDSNKRSQSSVQDAWVQAIGSCASKERPPSSGDEQFQASLDKTSHDRKIHKYLQRLGADTNKASSIPRRFEPFVRYIVRNQKRIFDDSETCDKETLRDVASTLFRTIEMRQKRLLAASNNSRPLATHDAESALGQLKLLGLAKVLSVGEDATSTAHSRADQDMFVVHRLDCETSGVMVFARSSKAASTLSAAWRERKPQKVYHALVPSWNLLGQQDANGNWQATEGRIHLLMRPHPSERLKWIVASSSQDGGTTTVHDHNSSSSSTNNIDGETSDIMVRAKPSTTLWRFLSWHDHGILLELIPVTGRTHQLRVHCAHMGSPIVGDSLYADNNNNNNQDPHNEEGGDSLPHRLYLHAYQLTFPHPSLGEDMSFTVDTNWTLK